MNSKSIQPLFPSDPSLREVIQKNYLYYGPQRAMEFIYKDLNAVVKRIFSAFNEQEVSENIETLHLLTSVLSGLNELPFSSEEMKAVKSFKAKCFTLAEKILGAYPFVDATGYGKAASRLHNQLHMLQPVELEADDQSFPPHDSGLVRVIDTALTVSDNVVRLLSRTEDPQVDIDDSDEAVKKPAKRKTG